MPTGSRKRPKRYVETADFLKLVATLVRRAGVRVSTENIEDLRDLMALQRELDAATVQAVAGLRTAGVTWEQIGEATGTTRQAALMRWQPKIEALGDSAARADQPANGRAR